MVEGPLAAWRVDSRVNWFCSGGVARAVQEMAIAKKIAQIAAKIEIAMPLT